MANPGGFVDLEGPRLTGMCPSCNVVHETNPYDDSDPIPGVQTFLCCQCLKFVPYCCGGDDRRCADCWCLAYAGDDDAPDLVTAQEAIIDALEIAVADLIWEGR